MKVDDLERLAEMRTLADVPRYQARVRPDDIALEFEGRATTFADFDRHLFLQGDGLRVSVSMLTRRHRRR